MKGDGARCVLRTSSPHVGFSPKPSPPRKNKQTLEEEEGELEDGLIDKGTSDRVWKRSNLVHSKSGARASSQLTPGTPSSWPLIRGKAATFVSSHVTQEKGVPGARSTLRVDKVASFPNLITCAFIKHTVLELPFLLLRCLFVFPRRARCR